MPRPAKKTHISYVCQFPVDKSPMVDLTPLGHLAGYLATDTNATDNYCNQLSLQLTAARIRPPGPVIRA